MKPQAYGETDEERRRPHGKFARKPFEEGEAHWNRGGDWLGLMIGSSKSHIWRIETGRVGVGIGEAHWNRGGDWLGSRCFLGLHAAHVQPAGQAAGAQC